VDKATLKKKLIKAAEEGAFGKIAALIKSGANPNARNEYGWDAMWCACDDTKYKMYPQRIDNWIKSLEALIAGGGDVNTRYPKYGNRTILIQVSESGLDDAVRVLLRHGADVHAVDEHGAGALHRASLFGHANVVEMLLAAGANINQKMEDGDTPLKWAKEGKKDHEDVNVKGGDFVKTIEILESAGGE